MALLEEEGFKFSRLGGPYCCLLGLPCSLPGPMRGQETGPGGACRLVRLAHVLGSSTARNYGGPLAGSALLPFLWVRLGVLGLDLILVRSVGS